MDWDYGPPSQIVRTLSCSASTAATDESASQAFWKTVNPANGDSVDLFYDLWDHNVQRASPCTFLESVAP